MRMACPTLFFLDEVYVALMCPSIAVSGEEGNGDDVEKIMTTMMFSVFRRNADDDEDRDMLFLFHRLKPH